MTVETCERKPSAHPCCGPGSFVGPPPWAAPTPPENIAGGPGDLDLVVLLNTIFTFIAERLGPEAAEQVTGHIDLPDLKEFIHELECKGWRIETPSAAAERDEPALQPQARVGGCQGGGGGVTTKILKPAQARRDKGLWWDRAWSLVEGCSCVSEVCAHCWSAAQAHIRAGQQNEKIQARYGGLTDENGRWTGEIRLMWDDLEKPLRVKKPTVWSVWNDLFHEDVPDDFIELAFRTMVRADWHQFMVLTKRPERMAHLLGRAGWWAGTIKEYRKHIWPGTSIENQEQADIRTPQLLQVPAAVRFVSLEPLLGPIDITPYLPCPHGGPENCFDSRPVPETCCECAHGRNPLHRVIAGGESGPGARSCHLDWLRSIRDQCEAAGVPLFLKQLGSNPRDRIGTNPDYPLCRIDFLGRSKRAGKLALLDGNIHQEWPG